jgi:hypothetical protein
MMTEHSPPIPDDLATCQVQLRAALEQHAALLQRFRDLERQLDEICATGKHGSGLEVSGSAVSIPRGESPAREQRIAARISAARSHKRPRGGARTAE